MVGGQACRFAVMLFELRRGDIIRDALSAFDCEQEHFQFVFGDTFRPNDKINSHDAQERGGLVKFRGGNLFNVGVEPIYELVESG